MRCFQAGDVLMHPALWACFRHEAGMQYGCPLYILTQPVNDVLETGTLGHQSPFSIGLLHKQGHPPEEGA
jgi:hypothetical protein